MYNDIIKYYVSFFLNQNQKALSNNNVICVDVDNILFTTTNCRKSLKILKYLKNLSN